MSEAHRMLTPHSAKIVDITPSLFRADPSDIADGDLAGDDSPRLPQIGDPFVDGRDTVRIDIDRRGPLLYPMRAQRRPLAAR